MSNTGTVKIALKVDDQGVVKEFRQIGKESETAGDKGERSFRKMDRAAIAFKATAGMTAATIAKMGIGVAALTAATVVLAQRAMESAVEIEKNSQMAGVTTRAYQELEYAVKKYHVSTDALTDGLKELNLRAEEFVVTGAGPGQEAFKRLGYSQDELNAKLKDTPALLTEIIQRMEGMETASKMRLADEIFGGQGGEQFVAVINGGAQALENFKQEAKDLGVVMDEGMIRKSIEAQQEVNRLTDILGSQFRIVVADLAPDIKAAADNMSEWVKENQEFIRNDIPKFLKDIATSAKAVSSALAGVTKNVAINSQAFALAKEGQISWIDFITSSTNELEKMVRQFDAAYNAGVNFAEWQSTLDDLTEKYARLGTQIQRGTDLDVLTSAGLKNLESQREAVAKQIADHKALIKIEKESSAATDKSLDSEIKTLEVKEGLLQKNRAAWAKDQSEREQAEAARLKESERAIADFYAVHAKATQSDFDYQVEKLDEQFAYYDKFVKDKAALDDWYIAEYFDLLDKQKDIEEKKQEDRANEAQRIEKEAQAMRYNMLQDLGGTSYYDEQIKAIEDYAQAYIDLTGDIVTAEAWKNNEIQKLNAETALKDIENRKDSFSEISANLSSIASLYKEGSKEQEAASAASKVAYAAEMAMLVQKNLMLAVGAVAQQGTGGDPYTAFARIAAMTAVMSGILSIANIDFSSGGGGSGDLGTEQRIGLVSGSGTVLGDNTAISESINNSMEFLEDVEADQYSTLVDIFYEMQDLNSNITGLATSIVRDYGEFSADTLGVDENWQMGSAQSFQESFYADAQDYFALSLLDIGGKMLDELLGDSISGVLGDLVGGIFGGGKTEKLAGAGIYVAPWSQAEGSPTYWKDWNIKGKNPDFSEYESDERIDGVYVKIYDTTKIEKDGGWGRSDHTVYDTDFEEANKDTVTYFEKVLGSFVDLAQGFSEELGVSSQEEIAGYTFEIGRINLQDLEGDEITDAIEGVFSEVGDTMIEDLFSDSIKKYQEVNEGLFETAIRLVTVKNVVTESFGQIGIAFDLTSAEAVSVSQDIVNMAGDLGDFQQNFKTFYESFYSTADVQANFKELAESSLKALDGDIQFPETKKVFKELVSSIDITSDSGMRLYTTLISLADGANEFYKYLEEIESFNDSINDIIFDSTMSDYGQELLALNRWYEEQVSTARDLGISLEKINEAYGYQLDALNKTRLAESVDDAESGLATAKSQYISAINQEIDRNQTIFDQIQDEIDLKKDLISENEDLLESFESLRDGIADFQSDLVISDSSVDPEYQLSYAKGQLDATVRKLYSTDQGEVQEALADLPTVSQDYLDLSKKMHVNERDQVKALGYVQEILNTSQSIASVQVDKTEDTIYGLNAQNTILLGNQAYYQGQITALEAIKAEISGTNDLLGLSLEQTEKNYNDAVSKVNEATTNYNNDTNSDSTSPTDSTETLDDKVRESYETFVKQMYWSELGRSGKQEGIDYWVNTLLDTTNSVDLTNFREAFRAAAIEKGEIQGGSLTDYESIVKSMYWDVLGRAGKQPGIDYWVEALINPNDSVDVGNFRDAFLAAAVESGEIPAFGDGGTVYGPTFALLGERGEVEHVTRDSAMQGVKDRLDKIHEVLWTLLNLSGDKKESLEDLLDIFERNTQGSLPLKTEAAA